MVGIRAKLNEQVTITISRGRYCLMASVFTFVSAMAICAAQELVRDGRRFDVFSTSIDSVLCALLALIVFYFATDKIVGPKQDSNTQ